MASAWQKTDEFCSIWSAAKPRTARRGIAPGEYPSDRCLPWKASEPVLSSVLKAKARQNDGAFPVPSTASTPRVTPKPLIELLPSTEARYPRSLTQRQPVQMNGQAWPKPDTTAIWNVVVQRTVRTDFPEHELRSLKPRIWRRGLEASNITGLQSGGSRKLSQTVLRPAGPGDLIEFMSPNWRELQIQEPAGTPRLLSANLAKTDAFRRWAPHGNGDGRGSVATLRLLGPSFAVSIPDPKALR